IGLLSGPPPSTRTDPPRAANPPQTNVLLAQPVLIALFLAADVDAVSLQIVLPCMEHAGHTLRVPRRLTFEEAAGGAPLDDHAAMRAHVKKRTHFVVGTAAYDDRLAGDAGGAEVVQVGQFRLVANRDPRTLEDVLKLVLENPRVGIDAAINPLTRLERRIRPPLLVVLCRHFIPPILRPSRGCRDQAISSFGASESMIFSLAEAPFC